jgi:redox-sensitive bicupin YhaK (pirin superfamily)
MTMLTVYGEDEQGAGFFDGGKFREQKPIGFPHEGGAVSRIGPLFYWAWGVSREEALIGMHPHQAFEIVSYMIDGYGDHRDSLGSGQRVAAGGAQFMRAGRGMMHEERICGEGFQIWFEPDLRRSIQADPAYFSYADADFPVESGESWRRKTVIGQGSPIALTADAKFYDIIVNVGGHVFIEATAGRSLAALAIRGSGTVADMTGQTVLLRHRDFLVAQDEPAGVRLDVAATGGDLRIACMDVPVDPGYPLYRK